MLLALPLKTVPFLGGQVLLLGKAGPELWLRYQLHCPYQTLEPGRLWLTFYNLGVTSATLQALRGFRNNSLRLIYVTQTQAGSSFPQWTGRLDQLPIEYGVMRYSS